MSDTPPTVTFWHVFTDGEGVSRQRRRDLPGFQMSTLAPPAAPQWNSPRITGEASVMVTTLPPGWVGDWHENPKPQWIVPLSGRWFVETMDGERVEMGPGDWSLGEDQGTRGRRGHRSGTVGGAPAVLLLIQRGQPWSDDLA